MATLESLKHKAGRLLGVVRQGQALAADHDALLQESYEGVYDDLDEDGISTWNIEGDIPDRCMPHVAALVAFAACDDIKVSEDRYNRILTRRNVAKPEIRRQVTPRYESLEEDLDY